MAKTIQFKRGTTAQVNAYTGALGEVVVDTDKDVIVVHDGATQGGFAAAAKANADGTISLINKTGTSTSIASTGLFNNTLTSTATNQALTAAQGKVLQDSKVSYASSLGWNQTWVDVTASRINNTTYTNSTGSPIQVFAAINDTNGAGYSVSIGAVSGGGANDIAAGGYYPFSFIVPDGATYKIQWAGALQTQLLFWLELR